MTINKDNHSSYVSFGEEIKYTKNEGNFKAFLASIIKPFPNILSNIVPFTNDLKHLCND